MTEFTFKRVKDNPPPLGEDVLVLIDGKIYEGRAEWRDIVGGGWVGYGLYKLPWDTSYKNESFRFQYGSWGPDPYWMERPVKELPRQRSWFLENDGSPLRYGGHLTENDEVTQDWTDG